MHCGGNQLWTTTKTSNWWNSKNTNWDITETQGWHGTSVQFSCQASFGRCRVVQKANPSWILALHPWWPPRDLSWSPRHHRIIDRGSSWQPRGCNPWVAHQQATTHHVLKPPKRSPFETMWLALAPVPGEWKHWNKVTNHRCLVGEKRKETTPRDTICQEWTCKHVKQSSKRQILPHYQTKRPKQENKHSPYQSCTPTLYTSKGTCRPKQGPYTSKQCYSWNSWKSRQRRNV